MKNITLSLDEAVLQRARVAAAHEGKSLSKYVAETLERHLGRGLTQRQAIDNFLAGPAWRSGGGPLPSREDIYAERDDRYERSDLRQGPGLSDEGGAGGRLDQPIDGSE